MALADDKAGQKEFFITFILYISLIPSLGQMAFNVPAEPEPPKAAKRIQTC
jgi:hypothetical protein